MAPLTLALSRREREEGPGVMGWRVVGWGMQVKVFQDWRGALIADWSKFDFPLRTRLRLGWLFRPKTLGGEAATAGRWLGQIML